MLSLHLAVAVQNIDEALSLTINEDERQKQLAALGLLQQVLRKRGMFQGTKHEPIHSRKLCPNHPDVDYRVAWGCPECLRELREREKK